MKEHYKIENCYLYMEPGMYQKYKELIKDIIIKINKKCKNLDSISFDDVSAGGVQLGGCLKSSPEFIYMTVTIKYGWENVKEKVEEFITKWNDIAPEEEKIFKEFTEEGIKYGWD